MTDSTNDNKVLVVTPRPKKRKRKASTDPVEIFVAAASGKPRRKYLGELPPLRAQALEKLEKRYDKFTPEMASKIRSEMDRFLVLCEIANVGWHKHAEMDRLRTQRNAAIQILHYDYGWKPTQIQRHIGARDRRVVDSAIIPGDRTTLPTDWSEERAKAVAKKAHGVYAQHEADALAVRPERDRMIVEMSTKPDPAVGARSTRRLYTNAAIATLAGMSTAAVAQVRNGTAPSARRAARTAA